MAQPTHLLLVEDDAIIAISQRQMLERLHYTVEVAGSGEAALERFAGYDRIALVLMDIDLGPGIDGPETARRMLEVRTVPIVFLTSHTEPEYVERVRSVSCYGYVVKCTGASVLNASIETALELYAAQNDARRAEQRIRSILRASSIGIGVSEGRRIREVNEAVCTITGYSEAELIGRDARFLYPTETEYRRVGAARRRMRATGSAGIIETQFVRKDGALRDVLMSFAPIDPADPDGPATFTNRDITELKQNEVRLASVLAALPDLVFLFSLDGTFHEFLGSQEDLLVVPPERFIGRSVDDVLPPYLAELTREKLAAVAAGSTLESYDYLIDLNGREHVFDARMVPCGAGFALSIARDITQQRRAEQQAAAQSQRLRRLFELSIDAILVASAADGRIVMASPSAAELFGKPLEAIVGAHFTDLHPVECADMAREAFDYRAAVEYVAPPVQIQIVRGDGTRRDVEIRGLVYEDSADSFVLGWFRDVSERVRYERDLLAARTDLELAQQIAGVGSWAYDPEVGVPRWSAEVYQIYERSPALGPYRIDDYRRVYAPDQYSLFERAFEAAVHDGVAYEIELRLELPGGREKWLRAIARPDPERGPVGHRVRGTIQDITATKRTEARIRALVEEKALLLRETHHRVKNSINTMISMLKIQADAMSDPGAHDALVEAAERFRSMSLLYDRLHQLESPDDVRVDWYLPALVREIVRSYPHRTDVRVAEQIESMADVRVPARTLSLIGIIVNELVVNCLKHAFVGRDTGVIAIGVGRASSGLRIELADDGVGIQRAPSQDAGGGFGLQVIEALVRQLGARLDVHSDGGTCCVLEVEL